jgi:hypothetical protein
MIRTLSLVGIFTISGVSIGFAKGDAVTVEDAVAQAETALDNGRVGEAQKICEKLSRTHSLPKEFADRAEVVKARTDLLLGQYAAS